MKPAGDGSAKETSLTFSPPWVLGHLVLEGLSWSLSRQLAESCASTRAFTLNRS